MPPSRPLRAVQGVQRGTLTVGISADPDCSTSPALIARYRRAYPGIELRIRQAGSTELGRLLGDRVVDVIFRAVADESSGFVSIPLASSSLAVVCHPDHALAGHAAVDLRALAGSALADYPLGWEYGRCPTAPFAAAGWNRAMPSR